MSSETKPFKYSSKNWFPKISAATILGFFLAIIISGIFAKYTGAGISNDGAKVQLTMWLVAPVWLLIISFAFLFKNGVQAWLYLFIANIAAILLFVIK